MPRSNRANVDLTEEELALQRAVEQRRAQQLAAMREPRFPSTGTEVISARLAAARTRRNLLPAPAIALG